MSYNNDGLLTKDQIKQILDTKYDCEIFEIKYKIFNSNYNTDKKDIVEYVFCGKKYTKESLNHPEVESKVPCGQELDRETLKNMTLTSLKNMARQHKIKNSTFKLPEKEKLGDLIISR